MTPLPSFDDARRIADSAAERITQHHAVRGYLRVVLRSAWWNVFHLVAIAAWSLLLVSEQGVELLRVSSGGLDHQVAPLLFASIAVFGLAVAVSAFVVAQAGSRQIREIAAVYNIDAPTSERICQVVAPVLLCVWPALLLALVCASTAWLVATAALVAMGLGALTWARRYEAFVNGARKCLDYSKRHIDRLRLMRVAVLVGFVAIVALTAAMVISPEAARQVGTLGVALLALGAWSVMLTLTFVAIPIRIQLSSLALLVPLIWLAASYLGDPNQFPRRPLDAASVEQRARAIQETPPTPLREAWGKWLLEFEHADPDTQIPVFLISAEGGGIRAAYWTARVLAEMDARTNGEFGRHTFLLSGVSGGSLGIAAYTGARLRGKPDPMRRINDLEKFLGRDYLSPLVARLLISEPLWQVFGNPITPRDTAFERQFAADWAAVFDKDAFFAEPFLKALKLGDGARAPVLMLNATNVEYGKRFVLSNLDLDGREADRYVAFKRTEPLARTLADLTVAEAVHLSARFPVVSPPASVVGLVSDEKLQPVQRVWGQVVDGGYFDNSGARSVEDVLEKLLNYRDNALQFSGVPAFNGKPATGQIDLNRLRPLLQRVTFHVIVIRNDPLARLPDESDIPTLRAYLNRAGAVVDTSADLVNGNLAPHMPTRIALNELLAPPNAFFAAREARGIASRTSLEQTVVHAAGAAQARCERRANRVRSDPSQTLTVSANCARRADEYAEISLSRELLDATDPRHFEEHPGCAGMRLRKDFALGWTLAAQTQQLLSCLARSSTRLDGTLEAISPPPAGGVAPVARN